MRLSNIHFPESQRRVNIVQQSTFYTMLAPKLFDLIEYSTKRNLVQDGFIDWNFLSMNPIIKFIWSLMEWNFLFNIWFLYLPSFWCAFKQQASSLFPPREQGKAHSLSVGFTGRKSNALKLSSFETVSPTRGPYKSKRIQLGQIDSKHC